MDLIPDYALPIPTTIIAEMLGVPEADRHRFHRWSRVIVASAPSGWGMVRAIPAASRFCATSESSSRRGGRALAMIW